MYYEVTEVQTTTLVSILPSSHKKELLQMGTFHKEPSVIFSVLVKKIMSVGLVGVSQNSPDCQNFYVN
jgi:hypothetical protein